jgi:Xaa-Pro dipeptidase
MERRTFLARSAAVAGATVAARHAHLFDLAAADAAEPPALEIQAVVPISDAERLARIEKARRLMIENGIDAMLLEGGTSMFYYTGVRWGTSERTFAVVIPARGELAWVTPGFEEQRARELIKFSNDVRVWQEDESPYRVIAGILRDRGATGKVGIEERLRFFVYDGVRQEMPSLQFVIATPVTAGCRMFKSHAELALMQSSNENTL